MSEQHRKQPEDPHIQREAVAWVQKMLAGDVTSEDAQALKRWRAQSPAHMAAFAWAGEAWRQIGPGGNALRDLGGEFGAGLAEIAARRRAMTRRAWLGGGTAFALAAVGYVAARPPLDLWPSIGELRADYRTRVGEQRSVTFAEDVSINMNTRTSIAIRSGEDDIDRLELLSGEASFTMPPHALRSLTVMAEEGQVRARSAHFDVRNLVSSGGSSVLVTCFTGAVRIEHSSQVVDIGPGQQVRYGASGLDRAASVDLESASDWQRGIVVFRATPLPEAIEEINRYRPGRIVIMNDALTRRQINGRFKIAEMSNVLPRLQQAIGAQLRELPGGIVLLS